MFVGTKGPIRAANSAQEQMTVPSRVLLGRERDTPFLEFGAFREQRELLPGLLAW